MFPQEPRSRAVLRAWMEAQGRCVGGEGREVGLRGQGADGGLQLPAGIVLPRRVQVEVPSIDSRLPGPRAAFPSPEGDPAWEGVQALDACLFEISVQAWSVGMCRTRQDAQKKKPEQEGRSRSGLAISVVLPDQRVAQEAVASTRSSIMSEVTSERSKIEPYSARTVEPNEALSQPMREARTSRFSPSP